jgi:Spy/CpxP family protein refolding chaperone
MKTKQSILSRIVIVLFFSMIMIHVSAQDKSSPDASGLNPGTQNPASLPQAMPQNMHGRHDMQLPPPLGDEMKRGPVPLELPDLTPEQHEKIKKAGLKHMSEMTPLKNQLREKKARLSTLLSTTPFDETQANQVADEIGKTASALLKSQIRHDRELRSILTPDQQVIFDSRPKPWMKKMR